MYIMSDIVKKTAGEISDILNGEVTPNNVTSCIVHAMRFLSGEPLSGKEKKDTLLSALHVVKSKSAKPDDVPMLDNLIDNVIPIIIDDFISIYKGVFKFDKKQRSFAACCCSAQPKSR